MTVTAVYSAPLLCGCYVIQVTNCLGLCRNYEHYDNRDGVRLSENKQARRSSREAPTSRKLTQIKPITFCVHDGNQASFEACVVDLRPLEEHTFSTARCKTAENVVLHCKVSHSDALSSWLLSSIDVLKLYCSTTKFTKTLKMITYWVASLTIPTGSVKKHSPSQINSLCTASLPRFQRHEFLTKVNLKFSSESNSTCMLLCYWVEKVITFKHPWIQSCHCHTLIIEETNTYIQFWSKIYAVSDHYQSSQETYPTTWII